MENSVKNQTINKDLCINCGICKVACPFGAISMQPNKFGEMNPKIDAQKCTNCGVCSSFCPNTQEKIKIEAQKVTSIAEPQTFGLENASYFVAWSKDKNQRQKSCSGGVVTELAKYLLENHKIDGMIHVERLWAKRGKLHFGARLSSSVEEIVENVSSAYQPIDFSDVLSQLEENKTYFVTGTPCVIRGLKNLFQNHKKYNKIKIITCALICSHNTNSQFVDYLTEINKLDDNDAWQINIRQKDDSIPDANNFNNHVYTKKENLLLKNRFKSGWTDIWRSYYFAMNVCNYCSDFWGYEADISVKDAWGEWAKDPLGKNIIIVRNKMLEEDLLHANVVCEPLSWDIMKNHQYPTACYKQVEAYNKNFKSIFALCNIKNGLLKNKVMSKLSKRLYKKYGWRVTQIICKIVGKLFFIKSKKLKKKTHFPLLKALKRIFKYHEKDKLNKTKTILVAGGYGFGNVGDEAQCAETLKILTERYPDYQIVNLTPNVNYSKEQHPKYYHSFASRVLFFDSDKDYGIYGFNNSDSKWFRKFRFLFRSFLIYLNAFLVRADLPTFFINANAAKFLYDLKTASLFYFCGGGYLTGSTQSRLWDGILICRVAHIFRVPVVMSGQTIGVWESRFNRMLARWGFKNVKLITVRDEEFSLEDLKSIGFPLKNSFPTHDDALFCEKAPDKMVDENNYITLNFHYWGMKGKDKTVYIEKMHQIIDYVLNNTSYNLVFIPMHATDKNSFNDYIQKYPSNRIRCFDYDFDFRKVRRVIADSKMCITMKHHPIIFAMGESVPVISLAFSKYYVHKNLGALMQYKMDRFSLDLEDENSFEKFKKLFSKLENNYSDVVSTINKQKEVLKKRKEKFLSLVDEVLEKKYK